jgi:tetratricopeptide (TPR) repeat protein
MSLRIEQLIQFIKDDPDDPFNHYALALEYCKSDEKLALEIFEDVVRNHGQYVPVYYQLARLYARVGQKEKAIQTFNDGIAIARDQRDLKTLRELNAALEELLEDED